MSPPNLWLHGEGRATVPACVRRQRHQHPQSHRPNTEYCSPIQHSTVRVTKNNAKSQTTYKNKTIKAKHQNYVGARAHYLLVFGGTRQAIQQEPWTVGCRSHGTVSYTLACSQLHSVNKETEMPVSEGSLPFLSHTRVRLFHDTYRP